MKANKTHEWKITANGIDKEWILMMWGNEIKISFQNIPENKQEITVKIKE